MYKYISILCAAAFLASCDGFIPETKVDTETTEDLVANNYANLYEQGMHIIGLIDEGRGEDAANYMNALFDHYLDNVGI